MSNLLVTVPDMVLEESDRDSSMLEHCLTRRSSHRFAIPAQGDLNATIIWQFHTIRLSFN